MVKFPESMDDLVYWTSRKIDEGSVKAWAYRSTCPECKKGIMGKPKDEKTGKPKIRALSYVCESCGHEIGKRTYEETLMAEIMYTCPHCKHKGETEVPFKRKKYKGTDAILFQCQSCGEKIPITKKMKEL